MSNSQDTTLDLTKLFNTVTRTLKENQDALNATDEYNHNHGDNMVQNFQTITRAVKAKKDSPASEQLEYASQLLSQRSQSSSAQLYSQGLAQAAQRFQGQQGITANDAMTLIQTLMGGTGVVPGQSAQQAAQQPAPQADPMGGGGGDLLGGLLSSFLGGGAAAQPEQPQYQPENAQNAGGIDINTLLTAGMAFFQARQQGAAPMQAIVQAVMAGSQMQSNAHQAQSGNLVATTLINAVGSMLNSRQ